MSAKIIQDSVKGSQGTTNCTSCSMEDTTIPSIAATVVQHPQGQGDNITISEELHNAIDSIVTESILSMIMLTPSH